LTDVDQTPCPFLNPQDHFRTSSLNPTFTNVYRDERDRVVGVVEFDVYEVSCQLSLSLLPALLGRHLRASWPRLQACCLPWRSAGWPMQPMLQPRHLLTPHCSHTQRHQLPHTPPAGHSTQQGLQ
jgi:hypothetical protein